MPTDLKSKVIGGLIILTILLAVTTPLWVKRITTITDLFADNTAIGLLAATVILLTWYNCKLGVAFAVLVAMVSVAVKTEGFQAYLETFANPEPAVKKDITPASTPFVKTVITPAIAAKKAHLQEKHKWVSKAQKKPQQAPKLEAFQSEITSSSNSNLLEPENGAKIIQDKMNAQMEVNRPCDKDFMTYTRGTNYHGYDVAGCRYDLKDGTQNGSIYGPPLSWCATYKDNKHAVPFYPLNG